jgi:hypothetical protein
VSRNYSETRVLLTYIEIWLDPALLEWKLVVTRWYLLELS